MEMYKKIFTILFMVTLLGFSAVNMYYAKDRLRYMFGETERPKKLKDIKEYTLAVDNVLSTNLVFGNSWNEMYATVYNAIGKNEENSFTYVRDKNGILYQGNFWNTSPIPVRDYVMRIKRIEDAVADKKTKVVVLLYPTKYNENWSDGYYGIPYNDYNDLSDEFVSYLRYYGINHIDYKQIFMENNMDVEDIFYRNDHHWRVEVAFDAFGTMVNYLNEKFDQKLDIYYTDINNYNVETYTDIFLGSQGRDAGVAYAGLEEYKFILPKFETRYKYTFEYGVGEFDTFHGNIEETLVDKDILRIEDDYERDMYCCYLNGIWYSDRIVNEMNEDGLNVLFLRDSYTSPLATFFSSYCSKMDMIWTAYSDVNKIENAVEEGDYDYIFVAMTIDSFINGGTNFYIEEEATDE